MKIGLILSNIPSKSETFLCAKIIGLLKNGHEVLIFSDKENKFDLAKYQKEIKNNLVNDIVEKLIVYLNLK